MNLVASGVSYQKRDGQCAEPSCQQTVDWQKHDKPPLGWATLSMERHGKKNSVAHATFMLCPKHTVNFVPRQPALTEVARKLVRVVIESPFAGDIALNLRYLRAAMRDALLRQEAPYASHALYTQDGVLDDLIPGERKLGMEAGFAWGEAAQKVAVYTDLGVSEGMRRGIERHQEQGKVVEQRQLPKWDGPRNTTSIIHELRK
jgi:hypothetical protein